jgi:hypothetical protein
MLEPSTWRMLKSGEEGREGTQKQKGRICMQLQSYQQSKKCARVFINRVFVGLIIKRGARKGCQMQRA